MLLSKSIFFKKHFCTSSDKNAGSPIEALAQGPMLRMLSHTYIRDTKITVNAHCHISTSIYRRIIQTPVSPLPQMSRWLAEYQTELHFHRLQFHPPRLSKQKGHRGTPKYSLWGIWKLQKERPYQSSWWTRLAFSCLVVPPGIYEQTFIAVNGLIIIPTWIYLHGYSCDPKVEKKKTDLNLR